jgi:hypothetical protein
MTLKEIHAEAIREFNEVQSAIRIERLQCLADRRFCSITGAQWEGPLGDQFENKPKFEVNKIMLSVMRIITEYRNNRITVDFVSKENGEYDKLADTCNGLYRADEQDSAAEEAYDNAFEEAVMGGFGAWRLRAEYEDDSEEGGDEQRIRIEPIFDGDTNVYFDLMAKRQDKSDARRCWVLTSMTYDAYREQYGEDPATWPKTIQQTEFDWITPSIVYVAEYYRMEEKSETVHVFEGLDGEEERVLESELEDKQETLLATGYKEVRQKKIKRKRVRKYVMSGAKILEDQGYIAGSNIPIVPMYGKRWYVDNVERCMGHVRLAKDSQRLKNMQISKLGEISALSSVEKPIMTPEQVAGHSLMWAEDNVKNYPYLLVNPVTDANGQQAPSGPVGYTKSPSLPQAMAALLQLTEVDMKEILGNTQEGEKVLSHVSGRAVEAVQTRVDMQTMIYLSNMAKAIKRSGEIWLGMARDIFVEEGRKMKVINGNGTSGNVELLKPMVDKETGELEYENDLSEAKFDVTVDVGPSSASVRSATIRNVGIMMTATQDPETLAVLTSMAMMNMEGENVGDVREYFRKKLLKMGVLKPTPEEAAAMAADEQQLDPQSIYLQAAADEATANATKARADTVLTMAKAQESQSKAQQNVAQTQKTLSEIPTNRMVAVHKVLQPPKLTNNKP